MIQDKEIELRRAIRDAIALEPLIDTRSLTLVVSKRVRRDVSRNYVMKLLRKVRGEMKYEMDNVDVVKRITEIRDRFRLLSHELARIAFWQPGSTPGDRGPSMREKTTAINSLVKLDQTLLAIEMDAGIYRRHLGEIETTHGLSEEGQRLSDNLRALWSKTTPVGIISREDATRLNQGDSNSA